MCIIYFLVKLRVIVECRGPKKPRINTECSFGNNIIKKTFQYSKKKYLYENNNKIIRYTRIHRRVLRVFGFNLDFPDGYL